MTATLRQALVARHAGVVGQALPETLLSSAQGRESEAPGVGRRTMDEVALVPLVARDRVLGGLWLVRSATPVRFSSDDLAFAEELAHRAALAIDNARLYLEAEQAKRAQEESFALLDTLFATAPVGLTFLDTEQRYVRINQALAATNGPPIETHLGRRPSEVLGRLGEEVEACLTKVLLTGEPVVDLEVSGETPTEPGVRRHWLASYYPVRSPHGEALGVGGVVADITDRKRAQELLAGESAILEHIARGAPLGETLTALARLIEHHAPGGLCSILVLDEHRLRLTMGAAPSLPPEYNAAIEGLRIGPDVGSCGTAAYTGRPVVVTDIAHDPLWESHRDLAREHGLAACWSAPITGYKGGEVLGTFAIYYRRARGPGDKEWELVELATYLAAIAIERERWEINRWRESRAAGEGMPPP